MNRHDKPVLTQGYIDMLELVPEKFLEDDEMAALKAWRNRES